MWPRAAANQSIKIPFRPHLHSKLLYITIQAPSLKHATLTCSTLLCANLKCTLLMLSNLCSCNICHMYHEERELAAPVTS